MFSCVDDANQAAWWIALPLVLSSLLMSSGGVALVLVTDEDASIRIVPTAGARSAPIASVLAKWQ